MTPSDSPGPKIAVKVKTTSNYFSLGRVISLVNFVPNFVALATGVGRGEI